MTHAVEFVNVLNILFINILTVNLYICVCCRYFEDRFTLIPKLLDYIKEENDEKMMDRHAALTAKRLERTREMQSDDRF